MENISVEEIMSEIKNSIRNNSDNIVDKERILYHIDDFLDYEDEEFIRQIYFSFMKREADADGLECHLSNMESKGASKKDTIRLLYHSEEAKSHNIRMLRLYNFMVSQNIDHILNKIKPIRRSTL
ncbi:MAG: hypothetical protein DRG30_09235 [Epsilonproteobacteria bacterium]|nr:MAG: hypothetical protein DRG30_09235 [Campylobacterota bacterium]